VGLLGLNHKSLREGLGRSGGPSGIPWSLGEDFAVPAEVAEEGFSRSFDSRKGMKWGWANERFSPSLCMPGGWDDFAPAMTMESIQEND
jgi:hypothetical protein